MMAALEDRATARLLTAMAQKMKNRDKAKAMRKWTSLVVELKSIRNNVFSSSLHAVIIWD